MRYHVLSTMPFSSQQKAQIEAIGKECTFTYTTRTAVTAEEIAQADIILGNVPAGLISSSGKLKWFQLNSAGADAYCKPGILSENTILTCATGAYGLSVSEHMLALTMMLCRKMDLYSRNQTHHLWQDEGGVNSIFGSTTLVIGLGDIGGQYAARMKALGSHVIGLRRRPSQEVPEYLDELHTIEDLDLFLPQADFVTMVLPGTPETFHLMNSEKLSLMKKTAYLINAGRGNSVDLAALNQALRDGRIGGAALDVTDPEPLPSDSPLWEAPLCIITPHVAGGFHLPVTFENIVRITSDNFRTFLNGDTSDMVNIVNRSTGYRNR